MQSDGQNASEQPETNTSADNNTSLSDATARGFAWFFMQTIGNKLVSVVSQILLAYFLVPEDFGLVILAYSVTGFFCILKQLNIENILMQRPGEYDRLANAAFWLSLSVSLFSAALMVGCSPIVASFYQSKKLAGLLMILALNQFLFTLPTVLVAKLQIQMRFRELAFNYLTVGLGTSVLSVFFAWLGMGAYALLLPVPIVNIYRIIYFLAKVRPPIRMNPDFKMWRVLYSDGLMMIGIMFFSMITTNGDYMILGWMYSNKDVVGIYFFAFNLSVQLMVLVSANIAGTLMPVFSRLQDDPQRQARGLVRVSAVTTLIVAPMFIYQGVLAGPVIRLVFSEKWIPAIPVLQALSFAMAFQCILPLATPFMQAQRRLRDCLMGWMYLAIIFTFFIVAGSALGGGLGCAYGVILYSLIAGPIGLYYAIRKSGGCLKDVGRVYAWPIPLSVLTVAVAVLVSRLTGIQKNDIGHIAFVSAVGMTGYLLLARRLMPETCAEVLSRIPFLRSRKS